MSESEQYEILTIAIHETKTLLSELESLRLHPMCSGTCLYCKRKEEQKK